MGIRRIAFLASVVSSLLTGFAATADAQITVRVSIKRVWGAPPGSTAAPAPNGYWAGPAGITNITNMVTSASTYLQGSGGTGSITLQFTPATDIVDLLDPFYPFSFYDVTTGPTVNGQIALSWKDAMEAACEANPARYAWHPDAINVYLVNSINNMGSSGSCSFPQGPTNLSQFPDEDDIVFVAGYTNLGAGAATFHAVTLAHEIGHYFGLYHTFEWRPIPGGLGGCEPVPASCGALGSTTLGDLVSDTPADPYSSCGANTNPNPCTEQSAMQTAYGSCQVDATTLSNNIMAYYYACLSTIGTMSPAFSPGQRTRMSGNFAARSHVDVAIPVPTINRVAPSLSDYSVGNNFVFVAGANLPIGGSAAGVDVTLGIPQVIASGPTLQPEAIASVVTDLAPGSLIFAQFSSALPPGNHTVCVRVNGNIVAMLARSVRVTPYLDVIYPQEDPLLTNASAVQAAIAARVLRLEIGTRSSGQKFAIAVEAVPNSTGFSFPVTFPSPIPVAGFGYSLWLNLANPVTTTSLSGPGVFSTVSGPFGGPGGIFALPFSIAGIPAGTRFHVQCLELTPAATGLLQLSNVAPLELP
ncbi:MAG: hypothetical protein HYR85_19365 [Planctomycetes bacterium]|nr:hypothetical protein [Planctomycetota bacterium]MBI3843731.1 hypothetical protein [Planctomycetota bacterium]